MSSKHVPGFGSLVRFLGLNLIAFMFYAKNLKLSVSLLFSRSHPSWFESPLVRRQAVEGVVKGHTAYAYKLSLFAGKNLNSFLAQ